MATAECTPVVGHRSTAINFYASSWDGCKTFRRECGFISGILSKKSFTSWSKQ
jgi:hypothetical protein